MCDSIPPPRLGLECHPLEDATTAARPAALSLHAESFSSPQVIKFPFSSSKIFREIQPPRCHHSGHHSHVTWPTDSGFNSCFLQNWHSVDSTFNVLHENIPVQVKEAKSKFFRYLKRRNKNQGTEQRMADCVRPPHLWQPRRRKTEVALNLWDFGVFLNNPDKPEV